MKKHLFLYAFLMLSALVMAQNTKKVLVSDPIDKQGNVSAVIKNIVKSTITMSAVNIAGYEFYDESTRMQADTDIGKAVATDCLLVSEVSDMGGMIMIKAQLIDDESAMILGQSTQISQPDPKSIQEACKNIVKAIFDKEE